MIRLLATFVALALAGLATPAMARSEKVASPHTRVSCGPAGGAWRMMGGGGGGGQPQYAADEWATYTYSCRVGGRLLVVRHRQESANQGPCSAAANILVSAWVDGVRVISREQAGEYHACMSSDGVQTLVRVSLTAKGLTVCRALQMPAEMPGPKRCREVSTAGRRDPSYTPPRSPQVVRLRLTAGGADCRRWAAKLTLLRGNLDRSFEREEVPQAAAWRAVNDGVGVGRAMAARFDIDNDGVIDAVTWDVNGLRWRGHELAAPYTSISEGFGQQLYWYAVQPVRLDGRTLVYLRALPRGGNLGNFDVYLSEQADTSRFLIEARPDGKTRLVCGWGPRRLPEDRL